MLYNYSVADRLLGCYLQKPELCLNAKYPIKKEEFQVLFHRIIYATVYNLSIQGCKEVTIMDVDQFVKPYQSEYNVLQDNSFEDYIINITQLSSLDNFEYYYNEFRKMSCLNKYKEEGFDITKFYDEEKTEESQLENLNQYSLDDIVNYYDKIATDVKNEYLVDDTVEQMICGEDWEETLKEFEEDPMIGAGLCSPMLNSLYRGWCKGHLILRGAPSSFGKAQPINTVIPTPNGNKLLKDIKVGDYVFDRLGKPTKVLGVFPQGKIDCYEVTFSDGRKTYCNEEHIWNIYKDHHKSKTERVNRTLKEIIPLMKKDTISIPICDKVEYEEKHFDIDPYIVGAFIGNGCCKERVLSFSSNDLQTVEEIARIGNLSFKKNSELNYTWTFKTKNGESIKTTDYFGKLDGIVNVANEKYIPTEYKYGSIEQRYSLLQGLFDTDGSISKNYDVSYSTTSYKLAKDIREVLNSLGYFCNIHKENRKREVKNECYVLSVTMNNDEKEKLFRLPRKKDIALKSKTKKQQRDYNRLSFKSITKTEPCEMLCIYVDNEEHLYLTNDYIVTHNTLFGIADQVNVSCLKLWSDEQQCFVDNPYYQGKGAYIHTEQKMEKEIQPRFISTISGVPYHKILDGNFTAEEKERLRIAGEIARESGLMIINMPQFTAESLRQKIKSLALQGYEYITFDYVWNNFYIVSELKKINGGSSVREDQALLHLVDSLKMSAEEFDVGISTMIQLNGREKEVEIVDESCLFGSKSVKTKLDNGSIFMYPRKKELKQVEMLVEKWNHKNNTKFGKQIIPNGVSHCFKTRYSRYGQNIKIWHYLDKSIGRVIDMFATTAENYPIDIPMMYIEGKKEV